MIRKEYTFTEVHKYFEVGEIVTPTSTKCSLEFGKHYTVTECIEPKWGGDGCTVFVEGRRTGLSTEYLRPVNMLEDEETLGTL